MATDLLFRKDEFAIERYLENAAGALDQFDGCLRIVAQNLGLQPGGPRLVVSDEAVFDFDVHGPIQVSDAAGVKLLGGGRPDRHST